MRFFPSRAPSESSPLVVADNEITRKIIETHDQYLQLDPERTMLVGSAAMALYGIHLSDYDPLSDTKITRPNDLDFAANPLYMEDVCANGTKKGLAANVKSQGSDQTILRVDTPLLPADLITRFDDDGDIESFSRKFQAALDRNSRPVDGSELRIITPTKMLRELRRNSFDPKAAADYTNAATFFGRTR